MKTWDRLASLPLVIGSWDLDELELGFPTGFRRLTTIVRYVDDEGRVGLGEDVAYSEIDQERLRARGPVHELAGDWTLASFSNHLDQVELFDAPPEQEAYVDYRRWAFESAALDLALRQAGQSLHAVLGRACEPMRFVVSMRMPEPTLDPLMALRERYPGTRFKLDLEASWTRDFVRELRELDCVDTVDLKGLYEGTPVDLAPDPAAYAMVAEELPDVWIEDPAWNDETKAVLLPHVDRVTWDAPIHSIADVDALEVAPRCLNCKPSRFGALERLFDFYDECAARGISLYAGGQFELGVGRSQIEYLASIFHPDAPNDCAPSAYNETPLADGLPTSPMRIAVDEGFRFA